MDKTENW